MVCANNQTFYVKDCGMNKKRRAKKRKNLLQYPVCNLEVLRY